MIKIAGNIFMLISIYGMETFDEMPCELENYPKEKLNFPALAQVKEAVWFEGIQNFLIGVKAKKRFAFRS